MQQMDEYIEVFVFFWFVDPFFLVRFAREPSVLFLAQMLSPLSRTSLSDRKTSVLLALGSPFLSSSAIEEPRSVFFFLLLSF